MSDTAAVALRQIVKDLTRDAKAYMCDGDPRQAVAWSAESEITVRLAAKADDEIWVIAGSGMLVRFIAASDGDMGDVALAVRAILAGQAVEMFGAREHPHGEPPIATGFQIRPGPSFAGGATEDEAAWTARLAGPFAARQIPER